MRLSQLRIKNFRSFKDSGDIRIEPLQSFVGENNAGKSNILAAVEVFLTSGAGGVSADDYNDADEPIVITATFSDLTAAERRPPLRKYLLGDKLILEKQIALVPDKKNPAKKKPEAEYHGYIALPRDWWLSVEGVVKEKGSKPKWKDVAAEHGLVDFVTDDKGAINQKSYETGITKYLELHPEVAFVEPAPGETQALGLQSVLLDAMPSFHLLPAITDYSDEIDKRSTSTNFRRLMSDLSERILQADPRYQEITASIKRLTNLLNAPREGEIRPEADARLAVLESVEDRIRDLIAKLMPTVAKVHLDVLVDEVPEVFSRGVSVRIDDGKDTDVLYKGHGMQRCVVFALLQALVMNQRGQLLPQGEAQGAAAEVRTIILGIEEPELYIHPQIQRAIFSVLREFARLDQVLYVTHEPAFVDLANYHEIAVVQKPSVQSGSRVTQCEKGVLGDPEERKGFQFFNSFGVQQNELFFARNVVLVEGDQDLIAVLAIGRHLGLFKEFPEEIGYSIVKAGNKEEMPKFMKVLAAFGIPFVVLHELDGDPNRAINTTIKGLLNGNRSVELPQRLEEAAGHAGHFGKDYVAMQFFRNPAAVKQEFKDAVARIFKP
jgi:CRISPR-associated exonuclease Cas4